MRPAGPHGAYPVAAKSLIKSMACRGQCLVLAWLAVTAALPPCAVLLKRSRREPVIDLRPFSTKACSVLS